MGRNHPAPGEQVSMPSAFVLNKTWYYTGPELVSSVTHRNAV